MKKLLALLAVLGLTVAATAAPVVLTGPTGTLTVSAVANDLGSLTQYTIYANASSAASMVSAWDGAFSGTMNQVSYTQTTPPFLTTYTPTLDYINYFPADIQVDSHFLLSKGDYAASGGLKNQLVVKTTPYETTTSLGGKFGLNPLNCAPADGIPGVAQNFALAQIVIADGNKVGLVGEFADGTGNKFAVNVADISTLVVPEPMTLSVLAIGALGLIRRKLA